MVPTSVRQKIRDLDELAIVLHAGKAAGKRVIHCHGVFDLLHIGHIRHLAEARSLGDVLAVTVTPDRYVNKGPHQPAFPDDLRAEALAALDHVDYVAVNRWPRAVEAIQLLCPDVYVKGRDYKNPEADISGGIGPEAEAVRSVGGQIHFTENITFSSSALHNRYLPLFAPEVSTYLERFRTEHSFEEIRDHFKEFKSLRVLVIGEAILDEYVYCNALGKCAKEPILAIRQLSSEMYPGGALAVANHLAGFCRSVELVSYLGAHSSFEHFVRSNLRPNVVPHFVYKADSPTILKRRYVDQYLFSKLLEVYTIHDEVLDESDEREVCSSLEDRLPDCDLVIAADFGHGLVTPRIAELVSSKARFLAVNTQINAANLGFHTISKYGRADYICIHEGELRLDRRSPNGDLGELMQELSERMGCEAITVTRGKQGTVVYREGRGFVECPAFAMKVLDRVGAGDATLAVTALFAARNCSPEVIAFVGNMVGAQAVATVGNSLPIDRAALLKSIASVLK